MKGKKKTCANNIFQIKTNERKIIKEEFKAYKIYINFMQKKNKIKNILYRYVQSFVYDKPKQPIEIIIKIRVI